MTVNAITDTKKGRTGIAPTYLHTTPGIVFSFKSCPLTKLNGDLSRIHSADENCFVADQLWFMTRI